MPKDTLSAYGSERERHHRQTHSCGHGRQRLQTVESAVQFGYAEGRAEGEKHKALARGNRPGNMTSKRHALQGQKNKNNYIRL